MTESVGADRDHESLGAMSWSVGSLLGPAPILVALLDQHHRVVLYSQAVSEALGSCGVALRAGMNVRQIVAGVTVTWPFGGWDDAEALATALESLLDELFAGGTVPEQEFDCGTGADGEVRAVLVSGFPVAGPSGDIVLVGCVGVDASRLKEVERGLRRTEARFRALVESSVQDVWVADPRGWFVEDTVWERLPPAVVAKIRDGDWSELVHPDDRDRVLTTWREAFATGSPFEMEYRAGLSGLASRVIASRGVPVYDDGRLVEYVGTTADVTSRRLAETERERAYHRALNVALILQRSMLPSSLPRREDLRMSARHRVGERGIEVGGDWYDVIPLSAGRTALVVGDVMGRGLEAASVMGQVRSALRSFASLEMDPDDVMVHTCDVVAGLESEPLVTALYAVHDPWSRTLTCAAAGHPSPLVWLPGEAASPLYDQPDAPLGVVGATYTTWTVPFEPGSVLLLYTDGLLDMGGRGSISDPEGLAAWLAATSRDVDDLDSLAGLLVDRSAPGAARGDDVAVLVAAPRASWDQDPVTIPVTPWPASLRSARHACREALYDLRVPEARHDDIVLCANELLTNALVHGTPYRGLLRPPSFGVQPSGWVALSLRRTAARLYLEVTDPSSARPRKRQAGADAENGRGLALVEILSTRWGSRPTAEGKAVWCGFAL